MPNLGKIFSKNGEIEIMIDLLEDNNGTVYLKAMNFMHQFVSLAKCAILWEYNSWEMCIKIECFCWQIQICKFIRQNVSEVLDGAGNENDSTHGMCYWPQL